MNDRSILSLPGNQESLINSIIESSKNNKVILVIISGGPLDITNLKNNENITDIIWAGYPG